ncbi:MAG: hypothetical protein JW959_11410 [Pirellulales bacterium]|nr:hypothetical protein [Pirellulales bacterium]
MSQTTDLPTTRNTPSLGGGDMPFIERRDQTGVPRAPGVERRQFGNSYDDLSPEAAELARAVDQYKLLHRRRFVTFEEILSVVQSLGYRR